jgi:hypothetical protein
MIIAMVTVRMMKVSVD